MVENFAELLTAGGKTNSLGRSSEVIQAVLHDKTKLNELYSCMFNEGAWVRMRAADSFEKICREHPEWIVPYIDRLQTELATSDQPSIQWHLAQIYAQVDLTPKQKLIAINWLKQLLSTTDVDWIVAANGMSTLVQFTRDSSAPKADTISLLEMQHKHKSNSVVKRANKLLSELTEH